MPTYDYLCTKCGHRFEEIQKMSDPALTKCPSCKGKVKRLIGAGAGIIFKGSGFYVTDSRSSTSSAKGAKTESTGAAESAKPAPAAATASKPTEQSSPKTEKKDAGSGESKG
jgi:putative FmdB family regulatory protein